MIQQKCRVQRAGTPASPGDWGLSILVDKRRKLDKMAPKRSSGSEMPVSSSVIRGKSFL